MTITPSASAGVVGVGNTGCALRHCLYMLPSVTFVTFVTFVNLQVLPTPTTPADADGVIVIKWS